MDHIIVTKLRFKKRIHPNFWVRTLSFNRYPKANIGFEFNYMAFLSAFGSNNLDVTNIEEMDNNEKISVIVYGAALEYCRTNKKKIFFTHDDISNALEMASLKLNQKILKSMSYARMPDWLQSIMDKMPTEKGEKKN